VFHRELHSCRSDANLPSTARPLPPGPSYTRPEESISLPTPLGSYPQYPPSAISPSRIGKSELADSRVNTHEIGSLTSPNPDGQRVNTQFRWGFPYREIGRYEIVIHLHYESPNPELRYADMRWHVWIRHLHLFLLSGLRSPICRCASTCTPLETAVPHATSLRDFADRESTIQVFVVVENPETPNAETPKSDFSGSRATCPCPDQRLPLIREIATRDFNEHETLASSNAEARYADIRWSVPFCAFGLTPAQLLHDPTIDGVSRVSPANPGR
jgi:hypothetical protein